MRMVVFAVCFDRLFLCTFTPAIALDCAKRIYTGYLALSTHTLDVLHWLNCLLLNLL